MGERAVRTRRKPGGGKRREPLSASRRTCQIASFTPRVTKHGISGSLAVRHFFWSEPGPLPWFSRITRHETRITAFHRITAFNAAVEPRPYLLPRFLGHESRITNHGFFSNHGFLSKAAVEPRPYLLPRFLGHESRITKHESRLYSSGDSPRSAARCIPRSVRRRTRTVDVPVMPDVKVSWCSQVSTSSSS